MGKEQDMLQKAASYLNKFLDKKDLKFYLQLLICFGLVFVLFLMKCRGKDESSK